MTQRPAVGCLFEVVETLVLTLLIFFVIQNFVAQPYKVQQTSMEQTLEEGQYVLVDKLTPRWDSYHRGDIVVFDPPETWVRGNGTPFIKRIIGIGGDTIELRDGHVYVNDTALEEATYLYINPDGKTQESEPTAGGQTVWVIPDGALFVMGDHRTNSADSRAFGPILVDHVIGRAWLRYWPFPTFGILATPSHPELSGAIP